ncbi:MAG: hypothetical protein LIO77_07910 [Rikenellaceae bacterium]|nr:hypothetical protein [Rikenellaceae bacterium]
MKYREWVLPVDKTIGMGDILLILFSGLLFDPRSFIHILLVSMACGLVWWIVTRMVTGRDETVPLVSCMGCVLILSFLKEALQL